MIWLLVAGGVALFVTTALVAGVQIVGDRETLAVTLGVGAATVLLLCVVGLFIWNEVQLWLK